MKLSKYIYAVEHDDSFLLWNTFTNECAKLSPEDYSAMREMSLSSEKATEMIKKGFYIPDNTDEMRIMRFDNVYYANHNRPQFRILTTTACNARCPYCYEKGTPITSITKENVQKIISFIEQIQGDNKTVHIEWFGGEPLVNSQAINWICNTLHKDGFTVQSTMVSNGLLMNDELIRDAINTWHLEKIQITLDGVYEIYEQVKGVKSGSFVKLINTIKQLDAANINVNIRMNLTDENFYDLSNLITYLSEHLNNCKNTFYYVYPVFEDKLQVEASKLDKVFALNDKLISLGLVSAKSMYQLNYKPTRCFATGFNSYTIGPDGQLFTCSHIMDANGTTGNVENFSMYHPNRLEFIDTSVSPICSECILFPVCKGGCRAAELGYAKLNQCCIFKSCLEKFVIKMFEAREV